MAPPGLTDIAGLAARIHAAAQMRRLDVLYLGLLARPEDEPHLRRRLALLAACTRDNLGVRAEYRLAVAGDWPAWLGHNWRPGDLVVCHAEQRTRLRRQPLGHVLAAQWGYRVVMLAGFCQPEASWVARAARGLAFWAGALVFVLAFFALQVSVQRQFHSAIQTVLLALTVLVEFSLLAAWNSRMR